MLNLILNYIFVLFIAAILAIIVKILVSKKKDEDFIEVETTETTNKVKKSISKVTSNYELPVGWKRWDIIVKSLIPVAGIIIAIVFNNQAFATIS